MWRQLLYLILKLRLRTSFCGYIFSFARIRQKLLSCIFSPLTLSVPRRGAENIVSDMTDCAGKDEIGGARAPPIPHRRRLVPRAAARPTGDDRARARAKPIGCVSCGTPSLRAIDLDPSVCARNIERNYGQFTMSPPAGGGEGKGGRAAHRSGNRPVGG